MSFYYVEEFIWVEFRYALSLFNGFYCRLIDRYSANRYLCFAHYYLSDFIEVPAGAQIHGGISTCLCCHLKLFKLQINIYFFRGCSEICIYLYAQTLSNTLRHEILVSIVCKDSHLSIGYVLPQNIGIYTFVKCYPFHFGCDFALAGCRKLIFHVSSSPFL
ncbi:MAG: hypothetical protein BWX58_01208 [Deltaproteobacteria bacterium ADurb.Bin026]|nr:MAG: hypothetical protein BWX58_01208 [Deltaproteobacteria bacterium ADurb.Bin026]